MNNNQLSRYYSIFKIHNKLTTSRWTQIDNDIYCEYGCKSSNQTITKKYNSISDDWDTISDHSLQNNKFVIKQKSVIDSQNDLLQMIDQHLLMSHDNDKIKLFMHYHKYTGKSCNHGLNIIYTLHPSNQKLYVFTYPPTSSPSNKQYSVKKLHLSLQEYDFNNNIWLPPITIDSLNIKILKKFTKNICRGLLISGTHYILLFITHKYLCLFNYKTYSLCELKHLKLHKTITNKERMRYHGDTINEDYYKHFRIIHNQQKDELTVFGWFRMIHHQQHLNIPFYLLQYLSTFYRDNDEIYIICSKEYHVGLPSSWDWYCYYQQYRFPVAILFK